MAKNTATKITKADAAATAKLAQQAKAPSAATAKLQRALAAATTKPSAPTLQEQANASAAKAAKALAAKDVKPTAPKGPAFARNVTLAPATKLTWICTSNPKRAGSQAHALWEKAAYAKTYGDLVANVGKADASLLVKWGIAHNQVAVAN